MPSRRTITALTLLATVGGTSPVSKLEFLPGRTAPPCSEGTVPPSAVYPAELESGWYPELWWELQSLSLELERSLWREGKVCEPWQEPKWPPGERLPLLGGQMDSTAPCQTLSWTKATPFSFYICHGTEILSWSRDLGMSHLQGHEEEDPMRSPSEDGLGEWEPDWEQPGGDRAQGGLQEMGTFPRPMALSPAQSPTQKQECNKTLENSSVHPLSNDTWNEHDLSWSQSKDLVPPLHPHI